MNKWIKVKDQLPSPGKDVLCYQENSIMVVTSFTGKFAKPRRINIYNYIPF